MVRIKERKLLNIIKGINDIESRNFYLKNFIELKWIIKDYLKDNKK